MLKLLLARALAVCFPFHFMKLHYPAEKERDTYRRYRPTMYLYIISYSGYIQHNLILVKQHGKFTQLHVPHIDDAVSLRFSVGRFGFLQS